MRTLRAACIVGFGVTLLLTGCEERIYIPVPMDGSGGDAADAGSDEDGGNSCSASFVSPKHESTVTASGVTSCSDTVTQDVVVAAAVPNGTQVKLTLPSAADAGVELTAVVEGAQARFSGVALPIGPVTLIAQMGDCAITADVTVACAAPTCSITSPKVAKLNGVPVAEGGNRVSSPGSEYQVAFEVTTSVEDGQPVQLILNDATTTLVVKASGGKAVFPGVPLSPDGAFAVDVLCTAKTGLVGTDSKSFTADTLAPELTVAQPTDGQHFNPEDLAAGKFTVCAKTTSADALNPGIGILNLCAGLGTSTPTCIEATGSETGSGVCPTGSTALAIECPGGAPFDLKVSLKDAAGNPTTKTITGVTCASSRPNVSIISPPGDATPFTTTANHLLAASSGQALRDQDANKAGAQWSIVACASAAGKATLWAGQGGGELTQVGTSVDTVPAQAGDNCPASYGHVARFANATIPESTEDTSGALTTPSELRVRVEDVTKTVGQSPAVQLWVDSVPPVLSPWQPTPLCGRVERRGQDWTTDVVLASSVLPQLVVTSGGTPTAYTGTSVTAGFATFPAVTFKLGTNQISATAVEPAGNASSLNPSCSMIVGQVPLVTWTTPGAAARLCAKATQSSTCISDADANVAGWQGTLDVSVSVNGAAATTGTVTFSTSTATLGTANIDGTGHARLALTTTGLPDGNPVIVTATTSDINGTGAGSEAASFIVDTTTPGAVGAFAVAEQDRRQTSFRLSWTAPDDAGQAAATYDVRVSRSPIDASNFEGQEKVFYGGTPATPGTSQSIDVTNRLIDTNYYFAVAGVDAAGNRGPIEVVGPKKAVFNTAVLTRPASAPSSEQFGYALDGSTDLTGDGRSDLVVGSFNGTGVYIFAGSASFGPSAPTTTIRGTAPYFGFSVAVVGDIDDDGKADLAISSPFAGNGSVFIFRGRSSWPASLTEADADYTITADDSYAGTAFGFLIARLGDFDGDGIEDFAVSAPYYSGDNGRVLVVRGSRKDNNGTPTFTSATLPAPTRVITIDGPTGRGYFGYSLVGLGRFYQDVPGTTLVAGAPNLSSNAGRVYSFRGEIALSGTVDIASADNVFSGTAANQKVGSMLALLGPMTGSGVGLALGNYEQVMSSPYVSNGVVDVRFARSANGPFSCGTGETCRTLADSAATTASNSYGFVIIGGGFSGTATTASVIGDTVPDLVTAAYLEGSAGTKLYILDGRNVAGLGAVSNIVTSRDVAVSLPVGWSSSAPGSGLIKDINGDGYGDLAIGEYPATGPGRVAVLW